MIFHRINSCLNIYFSFRSRVILNPLRKIVCGVLLSGTSMSYTSTHIILLIQTCIKDSFIRKWVMLSPLSNYLLQSTPAYKHTHTRKQGGYHYTKYFIGLHHYLSFSATHKCISFKIDSYSTHFFKSFVEFSCRETLA